MSQANVEIVRAVMALRGRARESGGLPTHTDLLRPTSKLTSRAESSSQPFTTASTGWRA